MHPAFLVAVAAVALAGCDGEPVAEQRGSDPQLPAPHRGLLPDMAIPRPAAWGSDLPTVPQGYRIQAIATDLRIPRQTLVLPNGDILVAEERAATRLLSARRISLRGTSRAWARRRCPAAIG
ncbi:hypothetical protein ACFQU2_17490 [Siccirubricoccus deserti]